MAFNIKNDFNPSFYGIRGSGNAIGFQPVIPFRAWGANHLLRTTVSYSTHGPSGRGLASVSIFDLIVFNESWGRWGVGPLVQFLPDSAGGDTAAAGPAIGFVARKGKWNLGLFNQNLFGRQTRFSSVQPVIAYVLGGGWVLASGDAQWGIDWSCPSLVSIPIGLQVSKVTTLAKQPVKFFLNPEYNARSIYGAPHWTLRAGLTILAPAK
jgi:hypothetical protein